MSPGIEPRPLPSRSCTPRQSGKPGNGRAMKGAHTRQVSVSSGVLGRPSSLPCRPRRPHAPSHTTKCSLPVPHAGLPPAPLPASGHVCRHSALTPTALAATCFTSPLCPLVSRVPMPSTVPRRDRCLRSLPKARPRRGQICIQKKTVVSRV